MRSDTRSRVAVYKNAKPLRLWLMRRVARHEPAAAGFDAPSGADSDCERRPMRISSNLSFPEADNERALAREPVCVTVRVRELGAVAFEARVTDLSAAGCRIQGCDLPPRAEIWLGFAALQPLRGRIIWSERNQCGCQFYKPLGRRELLAVSGRQPPGPRPAGFPPPRG